MNLYVESSALLSWLFREKRSAEVHALINEATAVVTSDLTLVECDRAIHREFALGRVTRDDAQTLSMDLAEKSSAWTVMRLTLPVIARARQVFPAEPIRSLDALHLSCAIEARARFDELSVLTLDERIRRVGHGLGFDLQPSNLSETFNE